ncbi:MAG: flagellar basal body-associated FliL family protein [Syntrophomonadaceae bacterium]|nr:flagellar basal body-associated FliL family protein [Syntrophomonadaceae bacterium]
MAEGKASRFNLKFIIIGLALFVLAAAGAFGLFVYLGQNEGEAGKEPAKTASSGVLIRAGEFTVNIADPGGRRYLKTEIHLELKEAKRKEELEAKLPVVQDRILSVLSSKTLTDLEVYNRDNLRQELINQINSALGMPEAIHNVYFTVFVTQ